MTLEKPFDDENYHRMQQELRARVGGSRYKHSVGVADTAAHLADVYGYDVRQARMAGLVHDWNKAYTRQEECQLVLEFGLDINPLVVDQMPWLLHGPTAAAVLARDYPELGDAVFRAAARHTSASPHMMPLDMIVYIADLIEPNRTFQDVDDVRRAVGQVSLEELFFMSLKQTVLFLIEHNRYLHPDTIEAWNHYVTLVPAMQKSRLSHGGTGDVLSSY
ncbi:MAG: bis(5'-nucleosyl)-tetraphosphatase (symmetrical) YqeK [Raoultibacter sp.]